MTKAAKKRIEVEPSLKLKHTTLSCMGELDRDALRAHWPRARLLLLDEEGNARFHGADDRLLTVAAWCESKLPFRGLA